MPPEEEGKAKTENLPPGNDEKTYIRLPDREFATKEDWRKVYEKLGLPKSKDEYKLGVEPKAESHKKLFKVVKDSAFDAGITPDQAKVVSSKLLETLEKDLESQKRERDLSKTHNESMLKAAWKDEHVFKKSRIDKLLGETLQEDELAKVNEAMTPSLMIALDKLANKFFAEDKGNIYKQENEKRAIDIEARRKEILENKEGAYWTKPKNSPEFKKAKEEFDRLGEMLASQSQ